jgi:hypothetical protein
MTQGQPSTAPACRRSDEMHRLTTRSAAIGFAEPDVSPRRRHPVAQTHPFHLSQDDEGANRTSPSARRTREE